MSIMDGLNAAQDFLNQNNPLNKDQYKSQGFLLPATYSADGNGLPYSKVPQERPGQSKRNIITWFIPEYGIVTMYINPQQISYTNKKLIHKDRTKGGFSLQYWGEELTVINLHGTTGSSGIEGINMLHEMYRAEQYAFDGVGLTLAASNAANEAVNMVGGAIGGGLNALAGGDFKNSTAQSLGGGILGGILGMDSPSAEAISAKNIMSLAQLAFTVEMYYNGWVYRGYFGDMTVTEKASDFLLDYQITFNATQRRGYRVNYFPWSRSPAGGASQYDTPTSYNFNKVTSDAVLQTYADPSAIAALNALGLK